MLLLPCVLDTIAYEVMNSKKPVAARMRLKLARLSESANSVLSFTKSTIYKHLAYCRCRW